MEDLRLLNTVLAIMLLLAVGFVAGCGGETEPPAEQQSTTSPDEDQVDPVQIADLTGPLIDVVSLKMHSDDPKLRILDTRRRDEYVTEHIPGAVHMDVDAWRKKSLSDGGLKDSEFWAQAVGDLGISADSKVVVYGETPQNTARIWWTLRYLGVKNVSMLNGSWEQWVQQFYPLEKSIPAVMPVVFEPEFQEERLIETSQLKQMVESGGDGVVVVDARTHGEFSGQDARAKRGGHIPGAVRVEWIEVIDEARRFKDSEKLKEMFEQEGIRPDATIVTYCQSGARSSVVTLALELAGYENVKNYYAGWSTWGDDEEAPIERKRSR